MKPYHAYKPSGIDWIGDIPEHWEAWKISHAFTRIGSGTTPESGNPIYYENGTINWLNTGDLNDGILDSCAKKITRKALEDYTTLKVFPAGSLVMAMYGATIGKTSIISFETTTNQACCVFCKGEIIDIIFLQFWFFCNKEQIINLAIGGGQPNISQNILKDIRVCCPSVQEQTAIAYFLDRKTSEIDTLIANKQRLIELLKEERTAIINQAVTKGINPNVSLKPSGIEWIGDIPEHWVVKKMKYISILKSGENIVSEQIKETEQYPVFGGNGLRGYFDSYTHEGNYVLIGRQGALCGNINYAEGKFWASEHAIVCHLKEQNDWFWFGELLKSMNLNQYSQSAAQPGLAVEKIKNLTVPYPEYQEQLEISDYIKTKTTEIDTIISKTEKEIDLMKEYKTALINEVVTGKVDVREEVLV